MMTKLLTTTPALGALAVLAAAGTWYFLIRSDAPPPASLQGAAEASGMPQSAPPSPSGDLPLSTDALTGAWTIVPDNGTSQAIASTSRMPASAARQSLAARARSKGR
jgi:hypothetical protein